MKKHMRLLAIVMVAMMTMALAACGWLPGPVDPTDPPAGADAVAPVITVSGVPETCKVGDQVTIPAATATDDVDGDISAKIKVTVSQMKEDGVTVNRDLVYQKPGNVEQTFNAGSNKLLVYKITYVVKDAAGNEAKKEFTLTAVADNETGTLTLTDAPAVIKGAAAADVKLPAAVAIDQPGDVNISSLVTASLYEIVGGEKASVLFAKWEDFTDIKTVRIPAGNYMLVYSVKDAAGNAFETTYEIPVEIAQPGEVNLALDPQNFALDEKLGMSWVNEFGLVSFGHTSVKPDLDQTIGMTENVTKIYDQYVAITFNADAPTLNGQMFYSLAARGSKDRNTMPNKETCTWPSYLFLRIGTGRIESRVEKSSDKEMTQVKGYDKSLLDGKDHTLYVQWKNVGESATAADAAIYIYGWVDQTPAVGYDNADFIFKAVAGDAIDQGVLSHELFAEMWNETGAGWLSMDTYGNKTPYDDDHMRIKGLVIYDADETEFGVDITPPTVDVAFNNSGIFATNEAITIPEATFAGEETKAVYMVLPDGTKVDVSGTYTPAAAGTYTLVYLAKDENGNQGYRTFTITVADRDEVAPELTLGSQENLEINVGETVVLPTASAVDEKDGDLTNYVSIEIIGTEHITDLRPGGNYTPMTAGVQTIIYRVSDSFGNTAEKSFTITVKSTTSGQLLSEPMGIGHPGKGLTASQYVYDEKVSMVLNIEKHNVVMFNLRGPVKNTEWPSGMVLRFTNDGISLSGHGHDANIYGNTNWEFWKFRVGNDILFEYQVKNVVIDGTEYIRVQAWINGKALVWTGVEARGGLTGLEEGVDAIYRKLSDFTGDEAEADNVYSSPFFAAVYQGSMVIKELRMDGQSCTCPPDPEIPDGYQINFGSGHNFITEPVVVTGGGDNYKDLGQFSNEEYVAITFKGSETAKGALCLNLTGTAEGWSGGLFLRLTQESMEIRVSGPNFDPAAWLGGCVYNGAINDKEYTLVYKLTYITDEYGYSSAVQVEVWLGEAGGKLTKCAFAATNNSELITTNEAKDATIISSKAFSSAENMTPGKITVVSLGALNGDCTWTINKIETLAGDPDKAVAGWENILNDEATQVLHETMTFPANTDKFETIVKNVNENYVALTVKNNNDAKHFLYVNMTGSLSNTWDGGIGLRMANDGFYLTIGGVQNIVAQTNKYGGSMPKDTEFTLVYKLTYLQENGKYYAVQIEMWYGAAGGELTKVGNHAVSDTTNVSYDADKGAYIVKYNAVGSAAAFAPDCTVSSAGALNDVCEFTLVKAEILPVAPGAVVPGWEDILNSNDSDLKVSTPVEFPENTDKAVNVVSNLNEDYVLLNFKLSDASKHILYVNMTGSSSGWDGGIGLRMANDGFYLTIGGVQNIVAQTNIFGGAMAADTEYTLMYKLTYNEVNGKYQSVEIEMWVGPKGGDQQRIGVHAINDAEHCSYNEEKGVFVVTYDAVDSADKFKPDCTVVSLGAFNPTCKFTLTNVELVNAG